MTAQTRFCIYCGTRNLIEAKFCQNCGKPVSMAVEQENQTAHLEGSTECLYCNNPMQIEPSVTQVLCRACAAAYVVKHENGNVHLEILRF